MIFSNIGEDHRGTPGQGTYRCHITQWRQQVVRYTELIIYHDWDQAMQCDTGADSLQKK